MSKNSIVGIDVGTTSIKGVEMVVKRGHVTIVRAHSEPIPPGIISHNSFINEEELFFKHFQSFWKKGKFTSRTVSLGVNGDSSRVLTPTYEFDWASDEEFEEVFRFDLTNIMLLDSTDDHFFGFHTLREYPQREIDPEDAERHIVVPKKTALIVGVERETIDRLVNAALRLKLRPIDVDISSLALIRSYTGPQAGENYADVNIDIGADSVTTSIHKFGQPIYIRAASDVGGKHITDDIMNQFQIPHERAERRKLEAIQLKGIPVPASTSQQQSVFDLSSSQSEYSDYTDEEIQIIQKTRTINEMHISAVLRTIRESLDTFIDGEVGIDLTRLSSFTLSGGVSATPGLRERIASEFRNDAQLAAPITSLDYSSSISDEVLEREHEFAIATGLAVKIVG